MRIAGTRGVHSYAMKRLNVLAFGSCASTIQIECRDVRRDQPSSWASMPMLMFCFVMHQYRRIRQRQREGLWT